MTMVAVAAENTIWDFEVESLVKTDAMVTSQCVPWQPTEFLLCPIANKPISGSASVFNITWKQIFNLITL